MNVSIYSLRFATVSSVVLHVILLLAIVVLSGNILRLKKPPVIDVLIFPPITEAKKTPTTVKNSVKKVQPPAQKTAAKTPSQNVERLQLNAKSVSKLIKNQNQQSTTNKTVALNKSTIKPSNFNQKTNIVTKKLNSNQEVDIPKDDLVNFSNLEQSNADAKEELSYYRELLDYQRGLISRVQKHWRPSTAAGLKERSIVVTAYIGNDGKLLRYDLLEGADNELLNTQALNAVKLSAPFNPLPRSFPKNKIFVVPFKFTNESVLY